MAGNSSPFFNDRLSRRTFIFGLRLWVIVGICIGAGFVLILFLLSLCIVYRRNRNRRRRRLQYIPEETHKPISPIVHQEIKLDQTPAPQVLQSPKYLGLPPAELESPVRFQGAQIDLGKVYRMSAGSSSNGSGEHRSAIPVPEVSHLGWGHWYTLRELEEATGGFSDDNVIGEGGYGIVYHGILSDNSHIAVKNLLNNK